MCIRDSLEANNIDVLRISGDTPDEVDVDLDDIIISEEDDVDMENICLLYTSRCV